MATKWLQGVADCTESSWQRFTTINILQRKKASKTLIFMLPSLVARYLAIIKKNKQVEKVSRKHTSMYLS